MTAFVGLTVWGSSHTPGSVLRQSCAQVIVLVTLYFLKAEQVH